MTCDVGCTARGPRRNLPVLNCDLRRISCKVRQVPSAKRQRYRPSTSIRSSRRGSTNFQRNRILVSRDRRAAATIHRKNSPRTGSVRTPCAHETRTERSRSGHASRSRREDGETTLFVPPTRVDRSDFLIAASAAPDCARRRQRAPGSARRRRQVFPSGRRRR